MKPILILSALLFSSQCMAATVAIQAIEDRSANHLKGDCALIGIWATPGEAIREMLTDEILKTAGVEVVERDSIAEIYQNEIDHPNLEKPAEKKKFIAAKFAIAGVVSEFESCTQNQNTGIEIGSMLGIGGLGISHQSSTAHVGLDLRLIEVKTGKVLKTFRSKGEIEDAAYSLSLDIEGNRLDRDAFERAPLGKATRIAVAEAAAKIVSELKQR